MQDIAQVVIKKITEARERHRPSRDWNAAHRAGSECARELAYWRLRPEAALPEDPELQLIFEHGRWMEKESLAQLAQAGFELSEQDAGFDWEAFRLRGRIDTKIRLEGKKRPVEIKGYHPNIWEKLNTIDDFLKSAKPWLRKVPGQLLSYILCDKGGDNETAILYLLNKSSGRPKSVFLHLEGDTLEWGEAMLKRLETVNKSVAAGVLPERIEFAEESCGLCPFRGDCLKDMPAVAGPGMLSEEKQAELLAMLEEREALAASKKKYESVDKAVSAMVKGIPKLIVGEFLVTGKEVPVKEYTVPSRVDWRKGIVLLNDRQMAEE